MKRIDLNCDLAEGAPYDSQIIPLVSSVNVACGAHAGDPALMYRTVELASAAGTAVGAHPGYFDRENFGRTDMDLSPDDVYAQVVYQVGALAALAKGMGVELNHVKPHGALYNRAAKDMFCARAIARAVSDVNPELVLVGLAGSKLIEAGKERDLRTAGEFFMDRNYADEGTLVPRSQPNACITDEDEAVQRTIAAIKTGFVTSVGGVSIPVDAQTICIHGDGPSALAFAQRARKALEDAGIRIIPL